MKPVLKGPSFGEKNSRFVFRYAGWILAAGAILCAVAYPAAKRLELRANFFDLLPQDTSSIANLKELTNLVGGTSFFICVVESPDVETAYRTAAELGRRASSFPEVDYVDSETQNASLNSRKLLFLDLQSVQKMKQTVQDLLGYYRRKANPVMIDLEEEKRPEIRLSDYNLEHKVYRIGGFAQKNNSSMRVVMIKPRHTVGDFAQTRRLTEELKKTFDEIKAGMKAPVTLGLAGPYVTREQEYRTIKGDVRLTSTIATGLIALIILLAFRRLRYLAYVYIPMSAALLFTFAFTQATIGYLNLITAFLSSILLGLGADYTLYMLVSLSDDLKRRPRLLPAIRHLYDDLWSPLLMSMLTTVVCFGAMTISAFEGYRQFGLIAAVGILVSFVVIFFGLPSLFTLFEKYFPAKSHCFAKPRVISPRQAAVIVIMGILFSIYSLAVLREARFDYDFGNLQAKGDPSIELSNRMADYFGIQLSPVGIIAPNRARAIQVTDAINRYIAANPDTSFDFAASLATHVPRDQEEKIKIMREISDVLEKHRRFASHLGEKERNILEELMRQLKAEPLTIDELPASVKRQYEGDGASGRSVVYVYPKGRIEDGRVTKRFVSELKSLNLGPDVKLAGDPMLFASVLGILERDTPLVLGLSFLLILVLLYVNYRRLTHILWVLAPVLLGFLWMAGFAHLTGIVYNFINLGILPSILGVGIDSGIYIFQRYRETRGVNFYVDLQRSSKGVILSSFTSISAFVSLSFASHRGMASMGKLGVCGFLACMLASVYFVPAVLELYAARRTGSPVLIKKEKAA